MNLIKFVMGRLVENIADLIIQSNKKEKQTYSSVKKSNTIKKSVILRLRYTLKFYCNQTKYFFPRIIPEK